MESAARMPIKVCLTRTGNRKSIWSGLTYDTIDTLTLQGLETAKLSALRLTSQKAFYVVPTVYI